MYISIHASAWDATFQIPHFFRWYIYFNPRIRVGCDMNGIVFTMNSKISIHASAWDATVYCCGLFVYIPFQSTHPRGMRLVLRSELIKAFYFNPRIRVGCDLLSLVALGVYNHFNPRIRVGCDVFNSKISATISYFNPRIRVGCDVPHVESIRSNVHFNPRIRVGCDRIEWKFFYQRFISIHASAWDATNLTA